MRAGRRFSFSKSFLLHALMIALAFLSVRNIKSFSPPESSKLDVQIMPSKSSAGFAHQFRSPKKSIPVFDLRPDYMKTGYFLSKKSDLENKTADAGKIERGELLNTASNVMTAFDHLATQINGYLEYPEILIENNVQGTAVLDLYFDFNGKIDETNSRLSGSHVAIRGLLVKAARLALQDWYRSDVYRLKRDQFRNQHFHANLEVTHTESDLSELKKLGSDQYQLTRRRYKNEICAVPGSVDLACLAMKAKGAVENLVSDKGRIELQLLEDRLAHFDDLGLNGLNQLIRERS